MMKKFLLIIASIFLLMSCFGNTENVKNKNRIFRNGDKYFVFYKGTTFELPKDVYITQNKRLEQYFTKGNLEKLKVDVINKSELINDLSKHFPEGIETVSDSENVGTSQSIPVVNVGNKKFIDSIKFEQIVK